jgi:hypothetical protein
MTGLSGSLFSRQFLLDLLPVVLGGALGESSREPARRHLRAALRDAAALGPASPLRAVFDLAAAPLARALGFTIGSIEVLPSGVVLSRLVAAERQPAILLVTLWDAPLDPVWRRAVESGIAADARWAFCHNGRALRIVDTARAYTRRFLQIDIELALRDPRLFGILWGLLRADAFQERDAPAVLDRALERSDEHQQRVRLSLECGVESSVLELLGALARPPAGAAGAAGLHRAYDQALTLVYRILFLLFAEARGLVPMWHPTYRDGYSVDALCARAFADERARGLWTALQAIWRLAHAGCRAGDLVVTAFNGRLFAPGPTPLAQARRVPDDSVRRLLLALGTATSDGVRRRVSYGDLGVEQLGAIYERALDLTPAVEATRTPRITLVRSGRRKSTGSFYTPRSLTEYLVRRTLAPLVEGRSSSEILSLKVLDLAMGSGAFLVAACRYLASQCERARDRDGEPPLTAAGRAGLRRVVAQRCLYGVDLNPTAVRLGRLSLWLATLAAECPLTFLDHHLRAGDSLIGATLDDLARQPPGGPARRAPAPVPLFDDDGLTVSLAEASRIRARLADEPGDTLAAVREKEKTLAALSSRDGPLTRWKAIADAWCAVWFWPPGEAAPKPREFGAFADELAGGSPALPRAFVRRWHDRATTIARERRFFHWTLEFPEAFFDTDGRPVARGGFDAVVGNPPWDLLHGDGGALVRFARRSGIYRLQSNGHANLYQLFAERALSLVRDGGRAGLVLPSGLALDHGCAGLRRHLLERWEIDSLVGFENREGVFPIHRSLRFLLLTASRGGPTRRIPCRFGERDPLSLDGLPDRGADRSAFPIALSPSLLGRLSGELMTIPDVREAIDLAIVERAAAGAPPLGDARGWGARFGRELNATDDRSAFAPPGRGLPVVEGKQIAPFVVDVAAARYSLSRDEARRRLREAATFGRARLAYRDVASADNRVSLIAALVPPGVVTTHTLFCLKTALALDDQHVLCALLNSYVVNYLARQRIGTHLSAAIVERLPVPRPARGSLAHADLAQLAARLARRPDDAETAARLHARVASLYELDEAELTRILATFPLVPAEAREAALAAWRTLRG